MTRYEFVARAHAEGYSPPKEVTFAPSTRSEPHTHDQLSFVYVVAGTFILNTDRAAPAYQPGETCLLDANVAHAEEAGPQGATILVARKSGRVAETG
ncbi:Cupin domain protein [Jannaschia seosinensis]|uniref:Cupin domain protein n=1 Tax=Jannaschia seosinensis TaxID=313367 RepID=A0A0M7B9P3_9RHOB|nr:cupin domain-containing protein [Jannaschia seosinensis]CUH36876.1 Cupin domain protein [Jannaschia seosinensis]